MTSEKICANCGRLESDHTNAKCIFAPTTFEVLVCKEALSNDPKTGLQYCGAVVTGIHSPVMTDEQWISWRCPYCNAHGDYRM